MEPRDCGMKELISEELEQLGTSRTRKMASVHFTARYLDTLLQLSNLVTIFQDGKFVPF